MYPKAYLKVLMCVEFSHHHPILINLKEEAYVAHEKPFLFQNAWLRKDMYDNMLKESWNTNNSFILNLKNVVEGIKKWRFQSFDYIKRDKKRLL